MPSVWGMILQWGSTIKMSIELPAATRRRRDMTEKLLSDVKPEQTNNNKHFEVEPDIFRRLTL